MPRDTRCPTLRQRPHKSLLAWAAENLLQELSIDAKQGEFDMAIT